MCGLGGSAYLDSQEIAALSPEAVTADPNRVAAAHASFAALSSLGDRPVARSQVIVISRRVYLFRPPTGAPFSLSNCCSCYCARAWRAFSAYLFNRVGGRRVCFEFVLQACMRPCPPDGLPLLGPLPRTANAFIAAGHNCWGILWAPATGLAMSELLLDGAATSLSLDAFDPARFAMDGDGRSGKRTKTGREHVF